MKKRIKGSKMFKNAKVGDKVWNFTNGWGEIIEIVNKEFPIRVKFYNGYLETFTLEGLAHHSNINPTLFWDEVKYTIPKKPIPDLKIDTKVMVWNDGFTTKYKAHFKEFDNDGKPVCFVNGTTSFTSYGEVSTWDNYELV